MKPLNGWKSMIMYVAFGLHVTFIFPLERGDFSLWIPSSQNFEVTNFQQTAECSVENESNVCRGFHIDRQFTVSLMDVISIKFILSKSFEKPLVKPHFFFLGGGGEGEIVDVDVVEERWGQTFLYSCWPLNKVWC